MALEKLANFAYLVALLIFSSVDGFPPGQALRLFVVQFKALKTHYELGVWH